MRVRLQDLPKDRISALKALVLARGAGESVFLQLRPRRWLAVMGLLSLGAGLWSAWLVVAGFSDWPRPADAWAARVALLGLVYGPLALLEYIRALTADLRPCLLITPFDLLQCAGSHRPLEIHRLAEAKSFQRVEEYSGRTWSGLTYRFDFDGGTKVHFTLKGKEDIAAADRALALAQLAGRGEPLPKLPALAMGSLASGGFQPMPPPGTLEKLADPASETWLLVLGFLCLGFIPYAFFR